MTFWGIEFLDKDLYQSCINWCVDVGIKSVKDLEKRILSNEDYEIKWIEKCHQLLKTL